MYVIHNNIFFIMNKPKDRKREKTETEIESTEECKHNIVSDLIDIDPDRSITIYYCKYCFDTFDRIYTPKEKKNK